MKKILFFASLLTTIYGCTGNKKTATEPQWTLVWQDEFNDTELDTTVWSRIDRGTADWNNTQTHNDKCYEMRDGMIVLKGIVNDDIESDTAHYLTGGIYTKDKKSFEPGRLEICARLQGATGAWPAIWMLPFDNSKWPNSGEIDIMERLNFDSIAYQTVHTKYTFIDGHTTDPVNSRTAKINPDDFNIYGVDIYPDSVVFHINGERTHMYPRVAEKESEGQFPFYVNQYLLIDMQLGGKWVGEVAPEDLPIEMEVDWVKYYQLK